MGVASITEEQAAEMEATSTGIAEEQAAEMETASSTEECKHSRTFVTGIVCRHALTRVGIV